MFQDAPFRYRTLSHFSANASAMRQEIEGFFGTPQHNTPKHQCWDMWFVRDHYCYLRTEAANVVGHHVDGFLNELRAYAKTLGFDTVSRPLMSLYINGMHQHCHSDAMNGSLGYVFSLTLWSTRTFLGGETTIAREGAFDNLDRDHKGHSTYFDVVPAEFNQLLLFDDRVAHSVVPIQGTMNPLQGKIVLHGHIS